MASKHSAAGFFLTPHLFFNINLNFSALSSYLAIKQNGGSNMTMDTLESFLLWCTALNGAVLLLSSSICMGHTFMIDMVLLQLP